MLKDLIAPITGLLDKFIEDKDKKAALAHQIATMSERHAQELAKGQLEVNKVEAAHPSLFVSGWRPAVGWVYGQPQLRCKRNLQLRNNVVILYNHVKR